MPALPEKDQQILATHAGLVHAVVRTCHNRDLMPQLEQLLKLSEENGWTQLVGSIRRILGGQRDTSVLLGLDEEDRAIAEAILRGLQNPETLPDLNATPDPEHAAAGLASMIAASRHGNVEALKALADMGMQMRQGGGDQGGRPGGGMLRVGSGVEIGQRFGILQPAQNRLRDGAVLLI